ncbi:hypothetical protein ACGF0D_43225 [Kitasatospora sp. NPDC048298]|uniref:hypothetical protein n=1 Tax=Kitasatospora sp. NPDC048298 TaxID=3364049 RepID=UPI00371F90B2
MEPGVHLGTTINPRNVPTYRELKATAQPADEARRMIRLMKAKEMPGSGSSDYNSTMLPIMAISETDRSRVGGLLAMTELYNIKYGSRTFEEAFNENTPHFVGAKRGGAKTLKDIDRAHLKPKKPRRPAAGTPRARLFESVSRFVGHLGRVGGRGRGKASKFGAATNKAEVLDTLVRTLVKRAGYPAPITAQPGPSKPLKKPHPVKRLRKP